MTEGGWGQLGGQPGLASSPRPECGGEPWELYKGLAVLGAGGQEDGMGWEGVWLCGFIAVLHLQGIHFFQIGTHYSLSSPHCRPVR